MASKPRRIAHEAAHSADDAGEDRTLADPVILPADRGTPWLDEAMRDLGLAEIPGPRHSDRVLAMFADAGHAWVTDDETAWCAAAMCAWLERAGVPSPKTLAARGFLQWGREIENPVSGCIVVMWRGSPHGWQGHVGIYMGEAQGGRAIRVLGGNQRNAVNVAEFAKERRYKGKLYPAVLSYRMPRRRLKTQVAAAGNAVISAGGAVGAGAVAAIQSAQETAKPAADAIVATGNPAAASAALWTMAAFAVVTAAVSLYIYWQRGRDFRTRGV